MYMDNGVVGNVILLLKINTRWCGQKSDSMIEKYKLGERTMKRIPGNLATYVKESGALMDFEPTGEAFFDTDKKMMYIAYRMKDPMTRVKIEE